jgi:ubiquinone/menaquinone biosynthesis C-methylase UbiE
MSPVEPSNLDNHGERMVPTTAAADTFWEHICRYRFALPFARGKRVLDIACGEGYGSASLQRAGASSVIGIDISEVAVAHARQVYGVDARVGNAQAIALPDGSVDVVVSFETVEHLSEPEQFLSEIRRVLAPGGMAVISTPNKDVYRSGMEKNEFHSCEMGRDQFKALLSRYFYKSKFFAQRCANVRWFSRRILSAEWEQLRRVRGLSRMRRDLQRFLNPLLLTGPTDLMRRDPVQTIVARQSAFADSVNQYGVFPLLEHEQPEYIIAVCQG